MLKQWHCQTDVDLTIEPIDPILIKSGYATVYGPDMVPVVTHRNGEEAFYFPGSSLKGVLRSHFESIARTLNSTSVCLPYYDQKQRDKIRIPDPSQRESYGCGYRQQADTTAEMYSNQCGACRLFGSLHYAGRFSIGDAYPLLESKPRMERRNGVAIDRFTGGTVSGALFDLVTVVGGLFQTKIRIVNFEIWQLGALAALVQDLQDGLLSIGSGRSRALGGIRASVDKWTLSYLRPQQKVRGIEGLLSSNDGNNQVEAYGLYRWPGCRDPTARRGPPRPAPRLRPACQRAGTG